MLDLLVHLIPDGAGLEHGIYGGQGLMLVCEMRQDLVNDLCSYK